MILYSYIDSIINSSAANANISTTTANNILAATTTMATTITNTATPNSCQNSIFYVH